MHPHSSAMRINRTVVKPANLHEASPNILDLFQNSEFSSYQFLITQHIKISINLEPSGNDCEL